MVKAKETPRAAVGKEMREETHPTVVRGTREVTSTTAVREMRETSGVSPDHLTIITTRYNFKV